MKAAPFPRPLAFLLLLALLPLALAQGLCDGLRSPFFLSILPETLCFGHGFKLLLILDRRPRSEEDADFLFKNLVDGGAEPRRKGELGPGRKAGGEWRGRSAAALPGSLGKR